MRQDAKPLSAEEVELVRRHLECDDNYCRLGQHRTCVQVDALKELARLLATIDRQSEQLATARKALCWFANTEAHCPHAPQHEGSDYDPTEMFACIMQVANETLAALDAAAPKENEEPLEDAAMRRQSDAAFKAVVESANDVLIAYDSTSYDQIIACDRISTAVEALRAILHDPAALDAAAPKEAKS